MYSNSNETPTWKVSVRYFTVSISFKDETILNIDKEGRVISFILYNGSSYKLTHKRGFNGNWLGIRRKSNSGDRLRFWLTSNDIDNVLIKIQEFINNFLERINRTDPSSYSYEENDSLKLFDLEKIRDFIKSILKKSNYEAFESDKTNYSLIYSNIGILPPDRYGSLVLQVTHGCIYNKCSFCHLYDNIKYRSKSPSEFKIHIEKVKKFMSGSLGRFHSIFLGDANALAITYSDLIEILKLINEHFDLNETKGLIFKDKPSFNGIFSFLDVFTGIKLSLSKFKEFSFYNLKMIYLGIESGSDLILRLINKPVTPKSEILKIIKNCHLSNIGVSVIFIIGLGGENFSSEHVEKSLDLIREMDLEKNRDLIYLSKLVVDQNSMIYKDQKIQFLTLEEIKNQYSEFKEGIKDIYKLNSPKIIKYDIQEFIY